jgi:hypothetical protein
MEAGRRRWVPRWLGCGGRATSVGPKVVALGASVQAGVVEAGVMEADMPMWRARRVVLIAGRGGVGGSQGG